MVYIGPVSTLSLTAKTRAVKGYSPEQNIPVNKIVDKTLQVAQENERRRQGDRRKQARNSKFDTRQGGRRLSDQPSIDVSV